MKLKNFLGMMVIALCVVACSDDADKGQNVIPAQEVAGTYNGYTKAVAQYFPNGQYALSQSLKVEANTDETVNVSYTSNSFGTFSIKNAVVKVENSAYTITGTGTTVMGMDEASKKEYECTFSATVDGAKANPSFKFKVAAVMGGLEIEFIQGDAPAKVVVAGSYNGYTKAVAEYFPNGQYADDQTIKIDPNSDETVTVSYTSGSFGTFSIKNASVKLENAAYTITGTGTTVMGMDETSKKEYECELKATIDAAKAEPSIEFKVPSVMGGLTITFATGNAPAIAE